MSRRRPDAGPTISLFPFLAVLLCMMGGLLVLLVIFSRAAGDSARAAVDAAVADLEVARETAAWRVEQLRGVRDRTAADLASARLQLAGAEEHARELADELDRLVATVKALGTPGTTAADADVAALEARLKSARESIEKKRAEAANRPPAYAVVPYVGVNGTHRRPLYIECCIDGVFLQPEGIRLSPSDFEGPPGPGNPLASALRAAREQMMRTAQNPGDPAQQPYPLLLVRPSGVMAYYAAREAIASWGSEFGYQLVDEEWTLAFPPADPVLRDVEMRAVEESRRRLAWLAEVRPTKPAARQPLYRAATTRGGVVAEGGPSVLGDQSRWNWTEEQAAGANGAGGGRAAVGVAGAGGGGSGRGMAGDGGGPVGPGRPLAAAADDGADGSGDPLLASRSGRGGRGPGGAGGSDGAVAAGVGPDADGGPTGDGAGLPGGSLAQGAPRRGGAGAAAGSTGAVGDRYAGGSSFSGGGTGGGAAAPAGGGSAAAGGASGSAGSAASNAAGSAASSAAGSASGAAGSAAASGMAGGAGGQPLPGMLATGGSAASAQAGGATAAAGGGSVSLSASRGSNWASFASRERPIPITRPVRIECAADEFRILEDGNRRIETRVSVAGDTATAVDPLVEALRGKVARWGLAGDRMYWKPQLVLSAAAGGQGRRDDLQRLLVDSGLETTTDSRDDEIRNLPPVSRPGYAVANP